MSIGIDHLINIKLNWRIPNPPEGYIADLDQELEVIAGRKLKNELQARLLETHSEIVENIEEIDDEIESNIDQREGSENVLLTKEFIRFFYFAIFFSFMFIIGMLSWFYIQDYGPDFLPTIISLTITLMILTIMYIFKPYLLGSLILGFVLIGGVVYILVGGEFVLTNQNIEGFIALIISFFLLLSLIIGYYNFIYPKNSSSRANDILNQERLIELILQNIDSHEDKSLISNYFHLHNGKLYWKVFDPDWDLQTYYRTLSLVDTIIGTITTLFSVLLLIFIIALVPVINSPYYNYYVITIPIVVYFSMRTFLRNNIISQPTQQPTKYESEDYKDDEPGFIQILSGLMIIILPFAFPLTLGLQLDLLVYLVYLVLAVILLLVFSFGNFIVIYGLSIYLEPFVRIYKYNRSKTQINQKLDYYLLELDIQSEIRDVSNQNYVSLSAILRRNIDSVNSLPPIPNPNFGYWVLAVSVLFTTLNVGIRNITYIQNTVIPFFLSYLS